MDPQIAAEVERVAALVEALAAQPAVTLWAAEEVGLWVLAVALLPPAEDAPVLHTQRIPTQ